MSTPRRCMATRPRSAARLARSGIARGELYIVTKVDPEQCRRPALPVIGRALDRASGRPGRPSPHPLAAGGGAVRQGGRSALRSACARVHARNRGEQLHHRDDAAGAARAASPLIANQVEFHPLIDQAKLKTEADSSASRSWPIVPLGRGQVMKNSSHPGDRQEAGAAGIGSGACLDPAAGCRGDPDDHQARECGCRICARSILSLSAADMNAITQVSKGNRRLISPAGWAPKWDN